MLADNRYVGCDLMSWGAAGGLGYANLQHVCIRGNSFALTNCSSGEASSGFPLPPTEAQVGRSNWNRPTNPQFTAPIITKIIASQYADFTIVSP